MAPATVRGPAVQADLFDYIEPFYSRRRKHFTLGYASPMKFMEDWITTPHEQKLAALCRWVGRRETEGSSLPSFGSLCVLIYTNVPIDLDSYAHAYCCSRQQHI